MRHCLPGHGPRALIVLLCLPVIAFAATPVCEARSGEGLTPVIELYTSEGCSSCPSADQWLSTLKGKPVVAQAFHVAYWDYIGWVDRFAKPQHTERQRQLAAANGLRGIYTPQLVRNGLDWRDYAGAVTAPNEVARASITLQRATSDPGSRRDHLERLLERDRTRPQLTREGGREPWRNAQARFCSTPVHTSRSLPGRTDAQVQRHCCASSAPEANQSGRTGR